MRMIIHIQQSLLTSPAYHICGAATTPGLWINNAISSVPVQQQRGECDCGLFVIATALHITAGNNTEEVSFDQTKLDAKPPCAVFRDESPLTFSKDKKESQMKYPYKHSHSCVLPLW